MKQTSVKFNECRQKILFQIMSIPVFKSDHNLNVFWDGGSNCSLITFKTAETLNLVGKPVKIKIQTVNDNDEIIEPHDSFVY